MLPWIKQYQPTSLKEIVGQDTPLKKLHDAVQKKKPVLLYGPPGIGKTAAVYALAHDFGYELLEVNASDFRDKDTINKQVKIALQQRSLFMQEKLILIDELDGITGDKDRGGLQAILKLLENPPTALVMIVNDPWDKKFYSLRQKAEVIPFNTLNYLSITKILERICQQEGIAYDKEVLKSLARRAGNDARAAINDLQIIAAGTTMLTKESLQLLDQRDKTEKITDALLRIFKTVDFEIAYHAFDDVEEDYEKILLLMDENLPAEYEGKDLARAYDALAKADIFSARIRRRQHWRYLVYVFFFLSVGVALAKKEKYRKFVQYKFTAERLKTLYYGKAKYQLRNQLAEKLAPLFHCSALEVKQSVLPFLQIILHHHKDDKPLLQLFQDQLDLTKEELRWLVQ